MADLSRPPGASLDWLRRALVLTPLTLAACAPLRRTPGHQASYSGRLSLSVRGQSPQQLSASFDIRGNARLGELLLTSPVGTTLARARWWPEGAELVSGGPPQRFDSMDRMLEQLVGAALPMDAILDWLEGRPTAVAGWQADLSQYAQGRLSARRSQPLPAVELRLLLDPR